MTELPRKKEYDSKQIYDLKKGFNDYWRTRGFNIIPGGYPLYQAPDSILVVNSTIAPYIEQITPDNDPTFNDAFIQRCVRFRGLSGRGLLDSTAWSTAFLMCGTVSTEQSLDDTTDLTLDFLDKVVRIDRNQIGVTVDQDDKDSLTAIENSGVPFENIRFQSDNNDVWVKWQFGRPGPIGRGITFHLNSSENNKCADSQFLNIIHMDSYVDTEGSVVSLPRRIIDVGFGLERIISLQTQSSPFDTPYYESLSIFLKSYAKETLGEETDLRILTAVDNIRAIKYMLRDNFQPGNKTSGYILRKIMRNVFLQFHLLNIPEDTWGKLFSGEYREVVNKEFEGFNKVLKRADKEVKRLGHIPSERIQEAINFLKDTHGIPFEISKSLLTTPN